MSAWSVAALAISCVTIAAQLYWLRLLRAASRARRDRASRPAMMLLKRIGD